ncbi:hypothetical protein MXB_103 [Myxobolus squamalis]|nr:hypothetical protein MXB_103 [Myxobolus squamalis]
MLITEQDIRKILVEAYVFIFLPNAFKIMWESIHKMIRFDLGIDNSPIEYIEFIQDLRYHETMFPNKIEADISFPHFNARNILTIFQAAINQTILVQHEYNLMFQFQFNE